MERTTRIEEALEAETNSAIAKSLGSVVAGTYRLTRHIGSGGSSHVFEGEHVRLGKLFAVKVLRPELDPTRQAAQRFRREARAIARLRSEHIVSVIDCGELADHTPYLVMELLEGEDLRSLLNREGSLPTRRALPIIVEACRALTEAHAAGLVHRDLKPENLFITRRTTGEDWCKVLDFGVAKMDASLSTTQGAIVGTVRYMAPEQLADGGSVGPATDIHALGAILYECLSGHPAHRGDTIQEAMFSVLNREPRALADTPASVNSVILDCLAKDAAQRPSSAASLERMLLGAARVLSAVPEQTIAEDQTAPLLLPRTNSALLKSSSQRMGFLLAVALGALVGATILGWSWSRTDGRAGATSTVMLASSTAVQPAPAPGPPSVAPPAPVAKEERPIADQSAARVRATALVASPSRRSAEERPTPAREEEVPTQTHPPAIGNLDPANPYSE
jgi:eukaryotic-like serine/threonine-protein kinase